MGAADAMLKLFDRYILKELFPPFFLGLLLTAFVLLMNEILVLAELFIDKGIAAGLVLRVLALLVPSLLAFAVPMAVLVGILGGLARLSADSETVAFATLGISRRRFQRPFWVFGVCGWLVASALAMVIAPRANFAWVRTMTSSVLTKVQLRIAPLEFNESIPGAVLFIRSVGKDKSWEDVFVYIVKDPANPRLITARKGTINLYPERKRATLELFDGVVYSGPLEKPEAFSMTSFAHLEEEVDVERLFPALTSEKRVREKDIGELIRDANVLKSAPERHDRDYRSHWIEIHKKFALPFVCLLFVLVGVPLGLAAGRGGRTIGFTLSLGIILAYYALLTTGERLALNGKITPFIGMWGPNLVLAAAGLWLFLRSGWQRPLWPRFPRLSRGKAPLAETGPAPVRAARPALPAFRFPNILDRYVSRKYLAFLGLAFAGLMAASVVVTFFDRLDAVREHGKPLRLLLAYVWYRIPEFLLAVFPVAALAATLLALGLMQKSNEITAVKASGTSVYRLVVPLLVMGAAVSGLAFIVQERLAPAASIKSEEVWRKVTDIPARSYSFPNRHWLLGAAKDRIYHYEYFDTGSFTFSRFQAFDFDPARWVLTRRTFAEKAALIEDHFVLANGWSQEFSGGPAAPVSLKENGILPQAEKQTYFRKEAKEPAEMSYAELNAYTADVRGMGFEATRLIVDLQDKIAFPLAALVMTLLAIPFAFSMGRKGALAGIGLSVVIAMGYWGAMALFRSLGYVGVLTPFLAAWGANLVFGLGGAVLFFRLRT